MRRRALIAVLGVAALMILSWAIEGSDPAGGTGATPTGAPSPHVVVLNGHGYNYRGEPGGGLDRKQIEALRAEAQRRRKP
jgi:hypothetical protein